MAAESLAIHTVNGLASPSPHSPSRPPLGSSSSLLSPQLLPFLGCVSSSSLFLFAGLINVLKSICSSQFPGTLARRKKKSISHFLSYEGLPFSIFLLSPFSLVLL